MPQALDQQVGPPFSPQLSLLLLQVAILPIVESLQLFRPQGLLIITALLVQTLIFVPQQQRPITRLPISQAILIEVLHSFRYCPCLQELYLFFI